jgi:hypothetical protein
MADSMTARFARTAFDCTGHANAKLGRVS